MPNTGFESRFSGVESDRQPTLPQQHAGYLYLIFDPVESINKMPKEAHIKHHFLPLMTLSNVMQYPTHFH